MKKILITGCSSGIGKEFVKQFLELGHKIYATSRDLSKLDNITNPNLIKLKLDVSNSDDIENIRKVVEKDGIDVLINNAGYGFMGPMIELPIEKIKSHFEVNVFGQIELIQKIAPIMINQKSGVIVNIGSISGIFISPFASSYCATKAAFNSFSDGLRMELRPFGVNVITVQPGGIETDFGKNTLTNTLNVLKQNSIYAKYKNSIIERATFSQQIAFPKEKFVKDLVKKILKSNPPALSRKGRGSILLPTMKKFIPEKLLDYILLKKFGLK